MVIQVTKIGQSQTMFKKITGKLGEKEKGCWEVPKRKKKERKKQQPIGFSCENVIHWNL